MKLILVIISDKFKVQKTGLLLEIRSQTLLQIMVLSDT